MVLSTRRKHKAFVRAFRRKFASLPAFFKFRVHTNFSDTYNSIVVPTGVTKPTSSELQTVFDEEIVVEEAEEIFQHQEWGLGKQTQLTHSM